MGHGVEDVLGLSGWMGGWVGGLDGGERGGWNEVLDVGIGWVGGEISGFVGGWRSCCGGWMGRGERERGS